MNNKQNSKTSAFIATYNRLDQILSDICGSEKNESFREKLRKASKKNAYLKKKYKLISSLHELRCVLVHEHGNIVIATPSDKALALLKETIENLEEPVTIYSLFGNQKIETIKSEETLFNCLMVMKKYDYSQLPVYDGDEFVGIVSGNVVTRYLADHLNEAGEIVEDLTDVTIGKILKYAEKSDKAIFVRRDISIYDFLAEAKRNPSPLGVYIMTQDGKVNQKALVIITHDDMPFIIDKAQ